MLFSKGHKASKTQKATGDRLQAIKIGYRPQATGCRKLEEILTPESCSLTPNIS